MTFQIRALNGEQFAPLFALSRSELKARGAVRMIAQSDTDFPCRISLEDARKGESVILVHYEHQSVDTPYRASAAIFVRENGNPASLAPNEIPDQFRSRFIAARAFGDDGMMVDADLCHGEKLDGMIEQLFNLSGVSYIHLHYAKHGCYAAKVERVK